MSNKSVELTKDERILLHQYLLLQLKEDLIERYKQDPSSLYHGLVDYASVRLPNDKDFKRLKEDLYSGPSRSLFNRLRISTLFKSVIRKYDSSGFSDYVIVFFLVYCNDDGEYCYDICTEHIYEYVSADTARSIIRKIKKIFESRSQN